PLGKEKLLSNFRKCLLMSCSL
ncbi:excinuclease ABC, subunit A domain protein, partial [Chlamydia psittaci C1/97]